jgi:hypothetical protein
MLLVCPGYTSTVPGSKIRTILKVPSATNVSEEPNTQAKNKIMAYMVLLLF